MAFPGSDAKEEFQGHTAEEQENTGSCPSDEFLLNVLVSVVPFDEHTDASGKTDHSTNHQDEVGDTGENAPHFGGGTIDTGGNALGDARGRNRQACQGQQGSREQAGNGCFSIHG